MKTALFTALALACAAEAFAAASISRVVGEPDLSREGDVRNLRRTDAFQKNDEIVTKKGEELDVAWDGIWGCRILESTRASLAGIEKRDMKMKVEEGTVLFRVTRLPGKSRFKVVTPVAIASVRGTRFFSRHDSATGASTFALAAGKVDLEKHSGETLVSVPEGKAVEVTGDGQAKVRDLTLDETNLLALCNRINTGTETREYGRR